ncbi:hypothetical protein ACRRTK_016351 [Alexandromys fortis]
MAQPSPFQPLSSSPPFLHLPGVEESQGRNPFPSHRWPPGDRQPVCHMPMVSDLEWPLGSALPTPISSREVPSHPAMTSSSYSFLSVEALVLSRHRD